MTRVNLIDRYAASLRLRQLSPRTIDNYRWCLQFLERHSGKAFTVSIEEGLLTASDVWALLDDKVGELSQAYLRQIVSASKSWHRWGHSRDLWPLNGVISIPTPAVEDSDPMPLTPDQMLWLMTNARTPAQHKLLGLGGWHGCRIFESAKMDGNDWCDEGPYLDFIGKGKKRRRVPVAPAWLGCKAILTMPFTLRQMRWAYEDLRKRSPFDWTPHNLRDTFSQCHLDGGVEVYTVEAMLGHTARSTTLRSYGHIPVDRIIEAQRDLRLF